MRKNLLLAAVSLSLCALPGKVSAQAYSPTPLGVRSSLQSMDVEVQFFSPSIVRVLKAPQGLDPKKESLSVVKTPEQVEVTISTTANAVVAESSALRVELNLQTGRISFSKPTGEQLFTEKDYGAQFTRFDDAGNPAFNVRQAFLLEPEEAIYGLGQQQTLQLNQRGERVEMCQKPLYASVPVIQSVKGYGIFWDNYSPTVFNDNPQEMSFDSRVGQCIDYYFFYGGTGDGAVAQMRDLTGQAQMYPLWTYGFWQSRERYRSQEQTMEVLDKYRALQIPIDGIIQDWQYWGGNNMWNAMEFLNPSFPDPKAMIDHIHHNNAHVMISVWASFGPDTKPFKEMKQKGMLLNLDTWPRFEGVMPYDAFNPAARDLYWDYMNKGLFALGIDSWWLDSTEPDHFEVKESDFDQPTCLGSLRSVRNAFPLLSNKGVYEHQRAVTNDKRVYILTRCAFAGQQRYAANTWSGDVRSTWDTFKRQIPTGLNFSLTGIPYWNTDIGGFFLWDFGDEQMQNIAYHELYSRWFQYGTFTPMQRSHGSGVAKEIWCFGKKGDWAYDNEEKYIRLRYSLLPYLYSTAWDVTDNAGSFLRALYMDFAADTATHNIGGQYMFGKAFMVAPVTDPMYVTGTNAQFANAKEDFSTVKTWPVYLPSGTSWIDFWTGESFLGAQTIEREVPIDILPLYVRAGSIVPWGPEVQYATEKRWDNLEIRIYPGADGSFRLYEDQNDNYNYENGVYSTIDFTWDDAAQTLTISNRKGSFPGMLTSRKFSVVVISAEKPGGTQRSQPDKVLTYKGKEMHIRL